LNNELPQYHGKPTVYLDQNILDLFVKDIALDFASTLRNDYQVVYSDETLKEVKRSGAHAPRFLKILNKFEALQLKICFDQPGFIETDRATLTPRDAFEAYDEYCQNMACYSDIQNAMEQWLFKFCGGRVGDNISLIHAEQKEVFSSLMDLMCENAAELSDDVPEIEDILNECRVQMETKLCVTLDETERLMKQNIVDDKNWSGIKDFRNAVKLGPKELNNITPPNVLQKIWNEYRAIAPYSTMSNNIEDFFGLSKNAIYPDRPFFKHQKVVAIYNMLNTLGYYQDSKVHKERRFTASLSDTSHASLASFCNILISRDEYFVNKARAAYEFLEISTLVQFVNLELE
jgi:hypothetical protein